MFFMFIVDLSRLMAGRISRPTFLVGREAFPSFLNPFSGGATTTFNTTLRVMEGVCDGSLVACADDSYGSEKSALEVKMKPDTDYSIIVGGKTAADVGQFNLGFRLGPCP